MEKINMQINRLKDWEDGRIPDYKKKKKNVTCTFDCFATGKGGKVERAQKWCPPA